ncbi:MAG: hypothetical protein QXK76_00690 [Candidatus Woesearchaeota archaeon]
MAIYTLYKGSLDMNKRFLGLFFVCISILDSQECKVLRNGA